MKFQVEFGFQFELEFEVELKFEFEPEFGFASKNPFPKVSFLSWNSLGRTS